LAFLKFKFGPEAKMEQRGVFSKASNKKKNRET
jgi:hypothetical protein